MNDQGTSTATFITAIAALITAAAILWQILLLKKQIQVQNRQSDLSIKQNQLQALMQLESEWNSERMRRVRAASAENTTNHDDLEIVLEFLERFAYIRTLEILDDAFIWKSTLGWYAFRYYHYYKDDIILRLEKKWKDTLLYTELKKLHESYMLMEKMEFSNKDIENDLAQVKSDFFVGERHA